jgi:hypothetical protein
MRKSIRGRVVAKLKDSYDKQETSYGKKQPISCQTTKPVHGITSS